MAFEGGYTSAVNAQSRREYEGAEVQRLMQALMLSKMLEQRRATAQPIAGDIMTSPDFAPPQGPMPQPPMPGAPSVPMQPQGAPPGPPPGGMAPPAMMGPGGAPPMPFVTRPPMGGAPPAGAPPGAPPMAPDSWKAMPQPPQGAPGAPPSPGAPPEDAVLPRRLLSVADIGKMLAAKGIRGQEAFDVMESLQPHMDSENRAQLAQMRVENSALHAAVTAYQRSIQLAETEREHRDQDAARARLAAQRDERIDLAKQRLKQAAAKAAGGAGGTGKLKNLEYLYPKGADGLPDESQEPIGVRGTTASGKIITLDAEGNQKPSSDLGGGTAKEGAHVAGRQARAQSLERMDTNSLISEYKALSNNYTRSPEDNQRMKDIAAQLRTRKVQIPGGGGGGSDKPKPSAQDLAWIKAHPEDATKFKAHFGVDPPQ